MKKSQKMKTVGSALLIGAGVAALGGWGVAATALAVGSLASPLADTIPTFDKMGQVRDRKKDLKAQVEVKVKEGMDAGLSEEEAKTKALASTVEVQVPIINEQGQPVGFEPKQIAISEALDHVGKQQKMLALGAIGAVAQAGSLVAMGLGCPIMMVVGASVALPLLARGALFPSETWTTLKALPGKIWDGIKAVGQAIGRKLGLVKGPKGGDEAQPMSDSQKALFKTMAEISDADPKLAEGLKNTLEALHRPPTNEAEQKTAIAAGKEHEAQLAELKANHPELAARFEANMKDLIAEGAQQAEEAHMESMHDQVEQVVTSKHAQALLETPGVTGALKSVGEGREYGETVVRMMAQAEIFGNDEVYQGLLKNESSDKDSANMLKVYRAIEAEVAKQAAPQQQPAA